MLLSSLPASGKSNMAAPLVNNFEVPSWYVSVRSSVLFQFAVFKPIKTNYKYDDFQLSGP